MQQLTASTRGMKSKYEVINEEYRIASCRIYDLSGEQAAAMLKQFGGSPLSTLTVFYDPVEDMLVLNRDHKHYEQCRCLVELYLQSPGEAQEILESQNHGKHMAELIHVLNDCILTRHNNRELFILGKQKGYEDYDLTYSLIQAIRKRHGEHGVPWLMYMVYQYGMIQGKRAERERRKRRTEP